MSLWSQQDKHRANAGPMDPRAGMLRRFRGFALFWISILVAYFAGLAFTAEKTKAPIADTIPVFLLLAACILVASVWHAAALIVMSLDRTFDRRGPWSK